MATKEELNVLQNNRLPVSTSFPVSRAQIPYLLTGVIIAGEVCTRAFGLDDRYRPLTWAGKKLLML
jgi:hypothetical protein